MTTITSDELRLAAERIHAANGGVRASVGVDWVVGPHKAGSGFSFTATSGDCVQIVKSSASIEGAVRMVLDAIGTPDSRRAAELAKLKQAMAEHGITAEELK
jgi:hypothetical protein